mmetsp:Transcript_3041/g.8255  ORF Transcript_3041/g.8255 Transcript_3041/m.8255 type:complete len:226 (+) Transcript_3041:1348-2025(+)
MISRKDLVVIFKSTRMYLQAETARFRYAGRAKVSIWQKICFVKLLKRAQTILTQEVEVQTLLEVINRVAISSTNNNKHTEVISSMEGTNSNSSMDKELMVKTLGMVGLPKPSHISNKVNSNRVHPQEHMEHPLQLPHLRPSGRSQQHPMVNNTTTMKGLERQPGKNLQECRKESGSCEAYEIPVMLFDENVFCLKLNPFCTEFESSLLQIGIILPSKCSFFDTFA